MLFKDLFSENGNPHQVVSHQRGCLVVMARILLDLLSLLLFESLAARILSTVHNLVDLHFTVHKLLIDGNNVVIAFWQQ